MDLSLRLARLADPFQSALDDAPGARADAATGTADDADAKPGVPPVVFSGPGDEHGDTRETATAFVLGEELVGVMNDDYDVDFFSFHLEAGQTAVFEQIGNFDPTVTISPPSGMGGASGVQTTAFTATETGTHYLYVVGASVDTVYRLTSRLGEQDISGDTSTGAVIAVGAPQSSQSDASGDRDWFAFDAEAGQVVTFSVDSEFRYQRIRLYDDTGTLVSESSSNEDLLWDFTQSGRFYVEVDMRNADYGTAYTLSAESVADDYAANSTTTGRLVVGAQSTGRIDAAGDVDWFALDVVAGQMIDIVLSGDVTSETGYLALEFYNEAGERLGSFGERAEPYAYLVHRRDEDGAVRTYSFDALETGRIFVEVVGGVHDNGGGAALPLDYSLSVGERAGDVAGNSTSTEAWDIAAAYSGSLYHERDIDVLNLTLEADTTYVFSLSGTDGARYSMNLRAADPSAPFATVDYQRAEDGTLQMLVEGASGAYQLYVDGVDLPRGTVDAAYTISAITVADDHGDAAAMATDVTGRSYASGVNEIRYDRDVFRLDLGAFEAFMVHADGTSVSGVQGTPGTSMRTASNGALLLSADASGGTVFVETSASSISGDLINRDDYHLYMERVADEAGGTAASAGRLVEGGTVTGIVAGTNDADWYAFDVDAGETITFQVADFGYGGLAYTLYDAAGAPVGEVVSGLYEATFDAGGRYYLGVAGDGAVGDYAVSWITPAMPFTILMDPAAQTTVEDGAGSVEIYGFGGNDDISGGGGNDLIQTGLGFDTVRFGSGDGHDVVTDFNAALDVLVLGVDAFTTRAELQAMSADTADGLLIRLDGASTILLEGLSWADVSRGMLRFTGSDGEETSPYWGFADLPPPAKGRAAPAKPDAPVNGEAAAWLPELDGPDLPGGEAWLYG